MTMRTEIYHTGSQRSAAIQIISIPFNERSSVMQSRNGLYKLPGDAVTKLPWQGHDKTDTLRLVDSVIA